MLKPLRSLTLALLLASSLAQCTNLQCPPRQELGASACVCSSTLEPPVDGTCIEDACGPDGCPCTLEGIEDAITRGGVQVLQCTEGAIVDTTETIVIDNDVTLDARGNLTVQGDGSHLVFEIRPVEAELIGITVTRGNQAIRVLAGGDLTLTDCVVKENTSTAAAGGGIFNAGALTLVNTIVENNTATVGSGGGIFNDSTGTLSISDSTVSSNDSEAGPGGGIRNKQGMVLVARSEISRNRSLDDDGGGLSNLGGGLSNDGGATNMSVIDSDVFMNTASNNGGGLSNVDGIVEVTGSNIVMNTALAHGGGLSSTGESAIMLLADTTVSQNEVIENQRNKHGGGAYLSFGRLEATRTIWSDNRSSVDAGAILVEGGTAELVLTSSTISGNSAVGIGGGVRVYMGLARIVNSTIFDNRASDGGAIHLGFPSMGARAEVRSSTISNNDSVGRGEPLEARVSASISHVSGTVTFIQTLIDDTCCCGPPSSTTISLGHNIESPEDTCQLGGTNDVAGATPQALGLADMLEDNGGATPTLTLAPSSIAADYGPTFCDQQTDQRGIPRPQGEECDVGAVELE